MRIAVFGAFALLLSGCSSVVEAQSTQPVPITGEQVAEIAAAYHDAGIFDGVVTVGTADGPVYSGAFGTANVEFAIAHSNASRMRLASVSKPFTSAIVLRLEEEGILTTDQTVGRWLPGLAQSPFAEVTIAQLMRHSSGIANYQYKPPYQKVQSRVLMAGLGNTPVTLDDMIGTFADVPLEFAPGTKYSYSNANYILLQAIIEQAAGKTFADVLEIYVTSPLNLTGTGTVGFRDVVPSLAGGYTATPGGFEAALQGNFVGVAAPGGIYSTSDDMAIWLAALFGGRFFDKAETLEKMITPRSKAYNDTSFIGYGIFTSVIEIDGQSVQMIGHDGWGPPFTANMQYVPSMGLWIFAADNIGGLGGYTDGETVRMAEDIVRVSMGQDWKAPSPPAGLELTRLIARNGLEMGIAQYEVTAQIAGPGARREAEINRAGYAYLASQDYVEAVAVFALNTRLYPDSSNAWDSLGEAYEKREDSASALRAYREALKLSPDSERLTTKIAQLSQNSP